MRRLSLVFIDDHDKELRDFRKIVRGHHHCDTFQWPRQSEELFRIRPPDVFVSDLYLPPCSGDTTPTEAEIEEARNATTRVANLFSDLYRSRSRDNKDRMQKTMAAITEAYNLLKKQWTGLGQSPGYGVALLTRLKALYPDVPFVFYSRKITPEDVICVLQAGAVDAIRKGALKNEEVLARIASAHEIYRRTNVRRIRNLGLNANVTTMLTAQTR
jgi:DNA-binding NarL/FixJ family response regulator